MSYYKRFMVFSFPEYYPSGGLGDCAGSYDTIDEANTAIKEAQEHLSARTIFISSDGHYIFDREEGEVVT